MINNTDDEIKAALFQANGLIRVAAGILRIVPQELREHLEQNNELQNALAEARMKIVDKAEESLWNCVTDQKSWAIEFVLKTLGRDRGYNERQEIIESAEEMAIRKANQISHHRRGR